MSIFKYLFLVMLVGASTFAMDFGKMTPVVIEESVPTHAKVKNLGFKVGESGVILRWFDKEHSSIIARGTVSEIKDGYAYLKYDIFDSLSQAALPVPKIVPNRGDEVLMRYFYKRALLISPNLEIYQKITSAYNDVVWVHPDLFAAQLIDDSNLAPKKSDFKKFCAQYNVGILYFVNKTKGQAYDCHTFVSLKEDYITGLVKAKDTMKPFYSRFDTIEAGWMNLATAEVGDFYDYYGSLLEGTMSDADKSMLQNVVEFFEGF